MDVLRCFCYYLVRLLTNLRSPSDAFILVDSNLCILYFFSFLWIQVVQVVNRSGSQARGKTFGQTEQKEEVERLSRWSRLVAVADEMLLMLEDASV